jgi:hypothetical protein
MAAWMREQEHLYNYWHPPRGWFTAAERLSHPSVATLSEGVSLLCRPRQPLMLRHRSGHGGIMGVRPRLHICGLSSLIPAQAQNPRCEGMTVPRRRDALDRRLAETAARVNSTAWAVLYVGWLLSGTQANCCNVTLAAETAMLRREKALRLKKRGAPR